MHARYCRLSRRCFQVTACRTGPKERALSACLPGATGKASVLLGTIPAVCHASVMPRCPSLIGCCWGVKDGSRLKCATRRQVGVLRGYCLCSTPPGSVRVEEAGLVAVRYACCCRSARQAHVPHRFGGCGCSFSSTRALLSAAAVTRGILTVSDV
jgi:hypothetical protein